MEGFGKVRNYSIGSLGILLYLLSRKKSYLLFLLPEYRSGTRELYQGFLLEGLINEREKCNLMQIRRLDLKGPGIVMIPFYSLSTTHILPYQTG